jgi:hypothetical protein
VLVVFAACSSGGGDAELIDAARVAVAEESYSNPSEVEPVSLRRDGVCAAVVFTETRSSGTTTTGTAFMRDGEMVDIVTGDVASQVDEAMANCWR